MEPNPNFKFKPNFVAICVLFAFPMAVVELLPINGETSRMKRAATANEDRLWDSGVIPYVIDEKAGYTSEQKARFREAMDEWESVTCIKFIERNASKHRSFIRFTVSSKCECCSNVGKQGDFGQDIWISDGCHTKGVILHELGHVIGFHHEHQRPDRDEFISIQTQHISSGYEYAFNKHPTSKVNSLGEPYDFDSIMHYGAEDFGRESQKTIYVKHRVNGQIAKIGQMTYLSPGDIRQTNKLYGCDRPTAHPIV